MPDERFQRQAGRQSQLSDQSCRRLSPVGDSVRVVLIETGSFKEPSLEIEQTPSLASEEHRVLAREALG